MDVPVPLILGVALAAAVWGLLLALHLPTLDAAFAALIAVNCFGVLFAQWDMGPFKASVDRLSLVALLGLTALKRLLVPQPAWRFDRGDLCLAGLLVMLFISVCTLPSPPPHQLIPTPPTPGYLFATSFLAPAVVYWIVRHRTQSLRDIRRIFGFFVLFGLYLAFTAVCEVHNVPSLVCPRYILAPRTMYLGRAVGPCVSSPVLGTWLTVATVSAILLRSQVGRTTRLLVLSAVPLFAYAQFLTKTRSGWMGFVVAVPLAIFLTSGRSQRRALVVSIMVVALGAGLFLGEKFLSPDRVEGEAVVARSTNQRLALLQRAVSLFAQKPLMGWGFGQFEHAARTQGGGGSLALVSNEAAEGLTSHNLFLRVVAETGLVGTLLFGAVFWIWTSRARTALSSFNPAYPERSIAILFLATLIAYCAEAMFHDVTFMMQENLLVFFLAGCLAVQNSSPLSKRPLPDEGDA
ncbi:MAG: O-antigen ligase family protein [Planctomycetes bacterium]|nr:O-antigen ligase family protein [Planctomycetota bacterium]